MVFNRILWRTDGKSWNLVFLPWPAPEMLSALPRRQEWHTNPTQFSDNISANFRDAQSSLWLWVSWNSLSFFRGSSLGKDVTSFHCSLKAKWILLFLPVKATWKNHPWKLWNWDTNINNIKCVRSPHITLGFGGLMPVFHQQYYDTLSPMQNCLKVISPLFTHLTIYLLHTRVAQMFLQCFGYVQYYMF